MTYPHDDYPNTEYGNAFGADDWDNTDDSGGSFDPLPPGTYRVIIHSAEIKETQRGGQMVKLRYDVAPGHQYEGRVIFDQQCINLPYSPEATKIGRAQHKRLCKALGFTSRPRSLRDLEGKALDVKVKIEKDSSGQYEDQNRVTAYKAPGGDGPRMPQKQRQPAPAAVPQHDMPDF